MERMRARVLGVTVGLAGAGALVGAICALIAINLALLAEGARDGWITIDRPMLVSGAAIVGAITGAVVTPLAGFAFLRAVPLGRAVVWCTLGTIVGATSGHVLWGFNPYDADLTPGVIQGAVLGFLSATVVLWLVHRHWRRHAEGSQAAI